MFDHKSTLGKLLQKKETQQMIIVWKIIKLKTPNIQIVRETLKIITLESVRIRLS